jgi:hypothetical protein
VSGLGVDPVKPPCGTFYWYKCNDAGEQVASPVS